MDETTPLLKSGKDKCPHPLEVGFSPSASGSDEKIKLVPVKNLFRFCDRMDVVLITIAVFGALTYGAISPAQFILFGQVTDDFVDYMHWLKTPNGTSKPDLEDSMTKVAAWYIAIAVGNFLFAWMCMGLFGFSAERQVHKMRLAMFQSITYQEIAWHDVHSTGELNTRLTEDLKKIVDGIGAKYGRLISSICSFVAAYIIGFIYIWKMSLIMTGMLPLMMIVGGVMAKVTGDYTARELEAYAKAGNVAEQSISSIRTVAAFGGEEKQTERYEEPLEDARKYGIKKGIGLGVGMAAFNIVLFGNYALSLWYGIKLVRDLDATPGDVMTVFFSLALGSMVLGQAAPSGEALSSAQGAAYHIFNIIDRKSKIDPSSVRGSKPESIKGDISLSDIGFCYPTRNTVKVLRNFNLNIPSGKRVALVGQSGCGKSTVIKLIQRFYDPMLGSVMIDSKDIKSFNVNHLRRFIGVVNQEPVLFASTIAENIGYGRDGATQEQIEEAAKLANAHDFIENFPQGYNTLCGERGAQMSGGQKQRIAIARALVKNPKILLLDEATSALDTESESVVQDALDKASEGRTTVIIAHRLSTIRNADIIVTVSQGNIAEMGTHDELMAMDSLYRSLVTLQEEKSQQEEDDEEKEGDDGLVNSLAIHDDGAFKLGSVDTTVSRSKSHLSQQSSEEVLKPVTFTRILKQNAPEWKYLLLGCLGAVLFGAYPPVYGNAFGGIYETFSKDPRFAEDNEDMKDDSKKWAIYFILIGVVSGIGVLMQNYYFSKSGEALTKRLRKQAFFAFLSQNVAFFDKPENSTGVICTRLASEVSSINGATGVQFGLAVSALVTIIGGFIVSFSASWQVSLVMLAFIPLLVISGLAFNIFLGGGALELCQASAGHVAEETLSNIQTVVSLGREKEFFARYREAMALPYRKAKRMSHIAGLATGSYMGIIGLSFGTAFRYGGYLVTQGDVTLKDMMVAIFTIIASAVTVGQSASMTPDFVKAKEAAQRLFRLLDKVSPIDSSSNEGIRPTNCDGKIELINVRFRYPNRRNINVLRNLSITVKTGQIVGLVGTSGCGKSTSISLIERFYDVNSGTLMIDGNDIKSLNLKWLRKQIGIVSQEPALFDLTIKDNISYGDTTRHVSDKEIEEAARSANIHQFIMSLPKGYDTIVGDKGTLISGGQKQRIAVARALIRNPKILLLDEATSALDTESEKVVQNALDKASIGRTTLVIAHRLSTIRNADTIAVIKNGRVVEQGTHQQLMAMKGNYRALHRAQTLAAKEG